MIKNHINIFFLIRVMVLFFVFAAFKAFILEGLKVNKLFTGMYLILILLSLTSDRFFLKGRKTGKLTEKDITSPLLAFFWFTVLSVVVMEHIYLPKPGTIGPVTGIILVLSGTVIRGLAIKTLKDFFSREVETWDSHKVIKTGIYKYIRHPAYAGNILQIIGFPLILNSYFTLSLSLITILIFLWRIRIEEKFLTFHLPEYRDYCRESKKLIPKIW